ncbi:MAG: sigma-70 family RNA polymerase sigma factor [Myxococcota bacterium]|nr:sigma-70 family RNA polymerase sigma factor [Myxococcota bacterium]
MRYLNYSDFELIQAISAGEGEALAVLYDRYCATLLGVARKMLSNPQNAEDLVHDVFMEAWRHVGDYSELRGTVRTWLLLRLRSRAIDRLRAVQKGPVNVEDQSFAEVAADEEEDRSLSPDRKRLRLIMDELPVEQRAILEHAYFSGLSASEIAEREKIPIGTVKSRLAAALRKLRGGLQDSMWSPS